MQERENKRKRKYITRQRKRKSKNTPKTNYKKTGKYMKDKIKKM